jgi:hypothetical protein
MQSNPFRFPSVAQHSQYPPLRAEIQFGSTNDAMTKKLNRGRKTGGGDVAIATAAAFARCEHFFD